MATPGVSALGRLKMMAALVGALSALGCGPERTTGSGDNDPESAGDDFEVRAGLRVGFLGGAESWTLKAAGNPRQFKGIAGLGGGGPPACAAEVRRDITPATT